MAAALAFGPHDATGQTPVPSGPVRQQGGVNTPPTNRPEVRPRQPGLICPDPAVIRIDQPDPHTIGPPLYAAIVQNVGLQEYRGAPGRQSVVISLHVSRPLSPSVDTTILTREFARLAPGEGLPIPFLLTRDLVVPRATHTITVSVVIDPRNASDSDPLNNDCNVGNNTLSATY